MLLGVHHLHRQKNLCIGPNDRCFDMGFGYGTTDYGSGGTELRYMYYGIQRDHNKSAEGGASKKAVEVALIFFNEFWGKNNYYNTITPTYSLFSKSHASKISWAGAQGLS